MISLRTLNHSTGLRLSIAALVGLVTGGIAYALGYHGISPLIGWDAGIVTFIVWLSLIILPLDAGQTKRYAVREDPSRVAANLILILASFASIGAVGAALYEAHNTSSTGHAVFLTAVSIVSIILSWLLIHTIFTLHYARIYYSEHIDGTIDFNQQHPPTYTDFVYVAFTVGMTYQIADTTVTGSALRRTVIRHALLSYVFGTVIVATTVSVIAGLGTN